MKFKKVLTLIKWFDSNNNLYKLICEGSFLVNNELCNNPEKDIKYGDVITYNNKTFIFRSDINLVMYKPINYLSANKDEILPVVTSLLSEKYQCYKFQIAGRLDYDVSGLLILTTSGRNNQRIANPVFDVEKEYLATTTNTITPDELIALTSPLLLVDQNNIPYLSTFKRVIQVSEHEVLVTLTQGRYHQVKNMFLAIKNPLVKLRRVRVGNLTLKDLKPGETYEFEMVQFKQNLDS